MLFFLYIYTTVQFFVVLLCSLCPDKSPISQDGQWKKGTLSHFLRPIIEHRLLPYMKRALGFLAQLILQHTGEPAGILVVRVLGTSNWSICIYIIHTHTYNIYIYIILQFNV